MKKSIISVMMSIAILFCFPLSAFAAELPDHTATTDIVYQEDGSYVIYETTVFENLTRAKTKTAQQTGTGYDSSGDKIFTLTLKASFSYDSSSASATRSAATYSISKSGWKKDSVQAYHSGDTAYADGTFVSSSGGESTVNLSLTCDTSGNIS